MEKTLTRAAEVRRVLKGGRPRKIRNEGLSALDAVQRIVSELSKARDAMKDAGLSRDDIKAALIYCTPEVPGKESMVEYLELPAPERQATFWEHISKLVQSDVEMVFLGILWQQTDREANPDGLRVAVWITPFLGGAGTKAEKLLLAAKHKAEEKVRAGGRPLDN